MRSKDKFKEVQRQYEADNPAKSSPDIKKMSVKKRSKRKEEKKNRRRKRWGIFFMALQGVVSIVFFVLLSMLGILPFHYMLITLAVIAVLFGITCFSQKRKTAGVVLGRIFSLLVVLLFIAGSVSAGAANYVLEEVTGAPYKTAEEKTDSIDLMGGTEFFSVAEDCFSVYVRDAKDDIDGDSASKVNMLASVNPETHQILITTIPGEYHITIPNISNGQKEKLEEIGLYGVEASMSALGSLYETEISYYLKVDFEWVKAQKELLDEGTLSEIGQTIYKSIVSISQHMRTNMTKYEVQELIKQQLQEGSSFKRHSATAIGIPATGHTYTNPEEETQVLTPEPASVSEIIDLLNRLEEGEILKTTIQLK